MADEDDKKKRLPDKGLIILPLEEVKSHSEKKIKDIKTVAVEGLVFRYATVSKKERDQILNKGEYLDFASCRHFDPHGYKLAMMVPDCMDADDPFNPVATMLYRKHGLAGFVFLFDDEKELTMENLAELIKLSVRMHQASKK